MKTNKILLVEDDLVLSDMYKKKLEKHGYQVRQAIDGLEGVTVLENFTPDVILLDIMMPGMDGLEALKAIKQQTSCQSKIIIFTNVSDKDKIEEAKDNGADEYLLKAATEPSDIIKKVEELIEKVKKEKREHPIYITPGLNIFKMKNPYIEGGEDIEISVNIKI